MVKSISSYFLFAVLILSCNTNQKEVKNIDADLINNYLQKGFDIYRTKNDAVTFSTCMTYFDTALNLAQIKKDTFLIGRAYFGKASVYDAWNRDKDKTIEYFTKSFEIFDQLKLNQKAIVKKIYILHIIAHAYEKKGDSSKAIQSINQTLYLASKEPDSVQYHFEFISQLALISTKVNNYTLADSILKNCCHQFKIKNDPGSYNYLDNYYLTQSRIDILGDKKTQSPYLDSFYTAYTKAKTSVDSFEMLAQLYPLYLEIGDIEMGFKTMKDYIALSDKQNRVETILSAQNQLTQTEMNLRKSEAENLRKANWIFLISLISLCCLIGGIGFIAFKLSNEKKKLSQLLARNEELRENLEIQNNTNLLLNKEIHHRIKNNLQFIHSLIDMQINHTESKDVKRELEDTQIRIRSVSNSYDMMRKEVEINLKESLNQFLNTILQNFKNHKSIQWICNIDDIQLDAKLTIPIFVILNELITNTIKHSATEDPVTAYINISILNNQLNIRYRDTNRFNKSASTDTGLGIEIIELLVLQLKGTMDKSAQYEYHFTFPYQKPNSNE